MRHNINNLLLKRFTRTTALVKWNVPFPQINNNYAISQVKIIRAALCKRYTGIYPLSTCKCCFALAVGKMDHILDRLRTCMLYDVLFMFWELQCQIPKYDHVSRYMLEVLHLVPVRKRIVYRVVSVVWWCQIGLAQNYLIDQCQPVSEVLCIHSLCSAERRVPFAYTVAMKNCAFSIVEFEMYCIRRYAYTFLLLHWYILWPF